MEFWLFLALGLFSLVISIRLIETRDDLVLNAAARMMQAYSPNSSVLHGDSICLIELEQTKNSGVVMLEYHHRDRENEQAGWRIRRRLNVQVSKDMIYISINRWGFITKTLEIWREKTASS
jgi:hypothetical protein